jgi:serine/threonine protein kinase, bacterial
MLLTAEHTELTADEFVGSHASVFAVFDRATQDSGNISYGARVATDRYFVKTAGSPDDVDSWLSHDERVDLLRNAVRLGRSISDPALPALRNVIESATGPVLVYDWVDGELLRNARTERSDAASAYARFMSLPAVERAAALDRIFRLHVNLAERGWIASDFYDGSLIYDFVSRRPYVVDLDHYRDAPFVNRQGRMFGSSRFMAPEEHELGAQIDERTTVFTLGRTVQQFLPTATPTLVLRACALSPSQRFSNVRDFYEAWRAAAPSSTASLAPSSKRI